MGSNIKGTVIESWNERRLKRIKFKKWRHFEDYCENSTIHGLRYFSKKNIHLSERVWWIVSVFCSMVTCCILISKSYKKWNENPVMVTFSEKMTPIKDIPFPAITICPETKSRRELFNYTDTFLKFDPNGRPHYGLSEREYQVGRAQFQICESNIVGDTEGMGDHFATDEIFDLIKEVAPDLYHSLISCKFRTASVACDYVFQEVITDDGLCFTFNALSADGMFTDRFNRRVLSDKNDSQLLNNWSLEDGYDANVNNTESQFLYPYRVLSAGSRAGLKLTLVIRQDDMDYLCRGPVQGFKVILHSPCELPQVSGQFFRIPIGQDVRVSIKPNMLNTMKSLKGYSPKRRQCYFNSERKLRYMRTYTQYNCELECLANFTLYKCGCVRFSMPRDNDTPICGVSKITCYQHAEDELLEEADETDTAEKHSKCNCLPACTSISYDAEITQATYEWENYFNALNFSISDYSDTKGLQLASLAIFFKQNQFITSKRSELVGLTDFVSACGGLLGLFMGVSLLSIVEVIYYSSLRLFCSIRTRKIEEKSKSVEKIKPRTRPSKQLLRPDPIWSSRAWYIGK